MIEDLIEIISNRLEQNKNLLNVLTSDSVNEDVSKIVQICEKQKYDYEEVVKEMIQIDAEIIEALNVLRDYENDFWINNVL